MNKFYITSDWHFAHDKDFLYKPRGFNNIEEHDKILIYNHNSIVDNEDDVYVLGDLILGDKEKGFNCLQQLKGKIHIILGNHCTNQKIELYKALPNLVEICGWATILKYKKYKFYLSHFPTCVGNYDDDKKFWCLCGHTHTKNKFLDIDKKCYHVEIDAHNNFPIEIENIIKDLKEIK